MVTMTAEEYSKFIDNNKKVKASKPKPNKYGAKKTVVDNIKFDSKKEAKRYEELKLMVRAGEITDLILQPSYLLQEGFNRHGKNYRPITYVADFEYIEVATGDLITEDVKGLETDLFKVKKKLFLFDFGETNILLLT